ncbi:MAG: class I SAM-dependent methyltransferase [Acidobacteria bacterium]|nr:class I SAM-dependent methyltransferase [Acidobacteriota bacterium]
MPRPESPPGQARSPYGLKKSPYASHARLLGMLPSEGNGRRVLDLGCASGYVAAILAGRGFDVVGVDRAGAVAGVPPFTFVAADLDAGLPPLDGRFDVIVMADLLEHLRDPLAFLRATRGLLAPGGVVLASLPNSGHVYFRLVILSGRFPAHDRGLFDRTHVHFFTLASWRELFAGAGLAFGRLEPTGVPVGLAFPRLEGTAAVHFAEWFSYALAGMWKRLFAYQFVVTARPREDA